MTEEENDELVRRVQHMLENKKTISASVRNDLVLGLLVQLTTNVKALTDDVRTIKGETEYVRARSIVVWIEKHPRAATLAAICLLALSSYRKLILSYILGIPPEMIP